VLVTGLCGLAAVAVALKATPIFRAEVIITPASEDGMGGAASLVNQFGGLASMVGVNLRGQGTGQDSTAVLESRRLVEEFIKRYIPLQQLFPHAKEPPTLWLAVKRFRENVVTIEEARKNNIVTVSIDWTDPATAARWANEFVALANELVRARAIGESSRNIRYINEQLVRTDVLELRRAMYGIIETETKRLMLANGRVEYAFTVVDPAVPPEIRSSPKRTLMVVVGTGLGFFIGVIMALVLNAMARYRRSV
jgi:uncharacterized protein involved in exopolysaccharide biosynthesis